MHGFKDVEIGWRGATYTLRAQGIMPLVAAVEDVLTGGSGRSVVEVLVSPAGPSMSRLCMAYGAMLRHAGAQVTDEEVYIAIQDDLANGNADHLAKMQNYCTVLMEIMSPPLAMRIARELDPAGTDDEKKTDAAA